MTPVAKAERKDALACPLCGSELVARGPGLRTCPTHGDFTCQHSIWRFLETSLDPFDGHWSAYEGSEIAAAKLAAARRFLKPVLDDPGFDASAAVVDAGCGDGVHFEVLHDHVGGTAAFYGLDASLEVLRQFRARRPSGWTSLHGDLKHLPLRGGSIDLCLSYGALAYSGDLHRGLRELVRVAKPGGRVGVWIYPRPTGLGGAAFRLLRTVVRRLPSALQARVADAIVPLLPWLPTQSGLTLRNATWRQCREIVLVNIAPPVLEMPRLSNLHALVADLGCDLMDLPDQAPGTLWMRKRTA